MPMAGRWRLELICPWDDLATAEQAYSKVQTLAGDDPDILTAWADASLMANGTNYTPEIADRITRALKLDPNQLNALWIGGIGENSQGNSAVALEYLSRLLPMIQHDPEAASQVEFMIERIGGESALVQAQLAEPEVAGAEITSQAPEVGPAAEILVSVSIAPEMQGKVKDNDVVFIFARASNGPPFPLAATRVSVADLPLEITLNDSMAMIPDQTISSVEEVVVTARISKAGTPVAQPGDLTSEGILSLTTDQAAVTLVIDRVVP